MPPDTAYSVGHAVFCTTCGAAYDPRPIPACERLAVAREFLREHRHEVGM